jgi:hypothetical protein
MRAMGLAELEMMIRTIFSLRHMKEKCMLAKGQWYVLPFKYLVYFHKKIVFLIKIEVHFVL